MIGLAIKQDCPDCDGVAVAVTIPKQVRDWRAESYMDATGQMAAYLTEAQEADQG